jgi:cysteine-rich repeat protein
MFVKFLKPVILLGSLSLAACVGICGDGVIDAENKDGLIEACDDGNATANDGCNATCSKIDVGFKCPTAGVACVEIPDEVCSGGIDEDDDDLIDCEDPNCANDAACAVCGDGSLVGVEVCDDGNAAGGDGCAANCLAVEPGFACPTPGEACINLQSICDAQGAAIIGDNTGDTTGGSAVFIGPDPGDFVNCPFSDVGGGSEVLLAFTPAATGTLTLTLVSVTDLSVYVRTTCADDTTFIGCADEAFPGNANGSEDTELTTVAVTGGVPLTLFVDAFTIPDNGPFTLTLAFQ